MFIQIVSITKVLKTVTYGHRLKMRQVLEGHTISRRQFVVMVILQIQINTK